MQTRWRVPVAVITSVLVALSVYHLAERARYPQTITPAPRLAALDTASLVALHELLRAVAPTDEILPATDADSDALLTALGCCGLMSMNLRPDLPLTGVLRDTDWLDIHGLIGGPTDA